MALFSRFLTLGHCRSFWRHEIDNALHLIFNKLVPTNPVPVWGWGAPHAFGWESPPAGWLSGDTFFEFLFLAGSNQPQLAHYDKARHAQEHSITDFRHGDHLSKSVELLPKSLWSASQGITMICSGTP